MLEDGDVLLVRIVTRDEGDTSRHQRRLEQRRFGWNHSAYRDVRIKRKLERIETDEVVLQALRVRQHQLQAFDLFLKRVIKKMIIKMWWNVKGRLIVVLYTKFWRIGFRLEVRYRGEFQNSVT